METGTKRKKSGWKKVLLGIFSVLLVLILAAFLALGWVAFAGPFKALSITRINMRYANEPAGGIIFYGASNFTLWFDLEEDMQPYTVQNHGFGGSTDDDLMQYADKLLYPYLPAITVFQSGSNDFVMGMSVQEVNANKDKMYSMFRAELPDTVFVVLSMLPLPGRTEYWAESAEVNAYLRAYCEAHDNMLFVDATEALTTANGDFRPEYFRDDGIHLNRDGQLVWGEIIRKALGSIAGA